MSQMLAVAGGSGSRKSRKLTRFLGPRAGSVQAVLMLYRSLTGILTATSAAGHPLGELNKLDEVIKWGLITTLAHLRGLAGAEAVPRSLPTLWNCETSSRAVTHWALV